MITIVLTIRNGEQFMPLQRIILGRKHGCGRRNDEGIDTTIPEGTVNVIGGYPLNEAFAIVN